MKKIVWGKDPHLFGPRNLFRNRLILDQVMKLKRNGLVLDFGCGNGYLMSRLVREGFDCAGLENSTFAIRDLKKRFNGNKKVRVIKGDVRTLYRSGAKYDAVVAGEVLEHLSNDKKAVEGFYKVLKKGGICVVTVPSNPEMWSELDVYAGHYRRYKKNDLLVLFEKSGFTVLKVFYWGFPISYLWDRFFMSSFHCSIKKRNLNLVSKMVTSERLIHLLSMFFNFDRFFTSVEVGAGLLLVAKKS